MTKLEKPISVIGRIQVTTKDDTINMVPSVYAAPLHDGLLLHGHDSDNEVHLIVSSKPDILTMWNVTLHPLPVTFHTIGNSIPFNVILGAGLQLIVKVTEPGQSPMIANRCYKPVCHWYWSEANDLMGEHLDPYLIQVFRQPQIFAGNG